MKLPPQALRQEVTAPLALRYLADAFRNIQNFDRFVGGLEQALLHMPGFSELKLQIDAGLRRPEMGTGGLTWPMTAADTHGTLRLNPGARKQFGPDKLHLMAGLADVLATVIGLARQYDESLQGRDLLRFLLNQAPVGIAAYTDDNRLIVANDLAALWLGDEPLDVKALHSAKQGFHVKREGRYIYGEARSLDQAGLAGSVLVMHDLTDDHRQFCDLLGQEYYRAFATGHPISIALVHGTDETPSALRHLAELRSKATSGERYGVYDGRLGVIFPRANEGDIRQRLAGIATDELSQSRFHVGYATTGAELLSPEALLKKAQEDHIPLSKFACPSVLVVEEHPSVAETVAMVLGRNYRVTSVADMTAVRKVAASSRVDIVIASLETKTGNERIQLDDLRKVLPGSRMIVLSTGTASPFDTADTLQATVVQKPFSVEELRRSVIG